MTKNPLVNALAAAAYITIVAAIMYYGSTVKVGANNAFIAPIALISLFTLSATVMGYLFLYEPFQMYFDGKKKVALDLFLQTTAYFGLVTVIALIALFSGIV